MKNGDEKVTVYYDGSCPRCIKDRNNYQNLAGEKGDSVCWIDITGQEKLLQQLGIDPLKALTELHVKTASGKVLSELDAYILLMSRVSRLKPLAFFIGLPFIRPLLARYYHYSVAKRLKKSGRYPQRQNRK
jgi:predicted DCC family thiol-disulfide oxidoreductase YuxK